MNSSLADVAVERSVLAGLCRYGQDAYIDIELFVNSASFTEQSNQAIFRCLRYLFDHEIDQIDVSSLYSAAQHLDLNWLFEKPSEVEYLNTVLNTHIVFENVYQWAERLNNLHLARILRTQLQAADHKLDDMQGDEPLAYLIEVAEDVSLDFGELLVNFEGHQPKKIGSEVREFIVDRMENPVEMVGISSGWPVFDETIGGGFRRKTVSLFGARTGVGKSLAADNIALHVTKNLDIPILYVDTEMTDEDHWCRLCANLSSVTIWDVTHGTYNKDDEKRGRVLDAIQVMEDMPYYYVNVAGQPFRQIISMMRRWVHQNVKTSNDGTTNDCLIIYDWIKVMNEDEIKKELAEFQSLGFMMTGLHNFAVKFDVPIFATVQLNRDGIREVETKTVAGSDRIVWMSTNFSMLRPKDDKEIRDHGADWGTHQLIPLKSRHGAGISRGDYINMHMEGQFGRITEGKTFSEMRRTYSIMENQIAPPELTDMDTIPFGESFGDG